jgi:RNA polymerase sigma factor (sigma-70 family)
MCGWMWIIPAIFAMLKSIIDDTMTSLTRDIAGRNSLLVEDIYTQMYDAVRQYILRRIGQDRGEDAEDLAQDTFVQLLAGTAELDRERLPRLVYTVARNKVIDYLRHHASIRAAQEYFSQRGERLSAATEQQLALSEIERVEERCLQSMPECAAQAFILYVHFGFSVKDISEHCDISPRTVENHIFRARRELRRTFTEQFS